MIDIQNTTNAEWLSLIHKFQGTKSIVEIENIELIEVTPDNHFYKLHTNKGFYCVYEVDYISSFEYEKSNIQKELGTNIKILRVKDSTLKSGKVEKYVVKSELSEYFYNLLLIKIL